MNKRRKQRTRKHKKRVRRGGNRELYTKLANTPLKFKQSAVTTPGLLSRINNRFGFTTLKNTLKNNFNNLTRKLQDGLTF